jgi:hypothetical protein
MIYLATPFSGLFDNNERGRRALRPTHIHSHRETQNVSMAQARGRGKKTIQMSIIGSMAEMRKRKQTEKKGAGPNRILVHKWEAKGEEQGDNHQMVTALHQSPQERNWQQNRECQTHKRQEASTPRKGRR